MALLQTGDLAGKATVTSVASTDLVPIIKSNAIKKVSIANLLAGGSAVTLTGTQTLTNKTLTAPIINSGTITNSIDSDYKRCSTQTDATTTTLANITGLTGFTVVPGTYIFSILLYGTCGGTGGWKVAFNYTTTVLSAINYNAYAYTASAVAVANGTTTTTQTSMIAANTAYTNAQITGTMVVSTGGTVDLQFAENSANSTSSIFVGSTMQLTRIA